jgi:hypothetical protein
LQINKDCGFEAVEFLPPKKKTTEIDGKVYTNIYVKEETTFPDYEEEEGPGTPGCWDEVLNNHREWWKDFTKIDLEKSKEEIRKCKEKKGGYRYDPETGFPSRVVKVNDLCILRKLKERGGAAPIGPREGEKWEKEVLAKIIEECGMQHIMLRPDLETDDADKMSKVQITAGPMGEEQVLEGFAHRCYCHGIFHMLIGGMIIVLMIYLITKLRK